MLLLILWRHFLYYSDSDRGNALKPSDSTLPVPRGLGLNEFHSELGGRLASILQRLLGLNMVRHRQMFCI
jgi:hypothetical protein